MRFSLIIFCFFFFAIPVFAEEPKKWEGYLEFMGKPGTARSLGQSDLFVPLWQDENDMTFFNLRGQIDDSDNNEFNVGLGHRQMLDEWILGGYVYFDRRYSDETSEKYNQFTLGLEALSESFDFRVNGYIPENKENEEESNQTNTSPQFNYNEDGSDVRMDYSQTDESTFEKSLHGFDAEIGYKLPLSSLLLEDTRLYLGGYHFIGNDGYDSVSGPRVRLEARIHDLPVLGAGSRLMLGVESQWDDPRGSQTFGLVSLRIPFGVSKTRAPLKGLERRMMEPVVRDIDIVTSQKTTTETVQGRTDALNIEGEVYTKVMEYTTATDSNTIDTEVQTAVDNGETPLVIIAGVGDNTFVTLGPLTSGATYTMAGQSLNIDYVDPFGSAKLQNYSFTPEGETPEVFGAVELNDSTHINGWDIDASGYDDGILNRNGGTAWVTNTKVSDSRGNGVLVSGAGSTLHLFDSFILGSGYLGLLVENGAQAFADNMVIEDNHTSGVGSMGNGSYLSIINSTVSNNFARGFIRCAAGLYASNGGEIYADNMLIEKNQLHGVRAEDAGSKVTILNSLIKDHVFEALSASVGAVIIAENVIVE